MAEPLVPIFDLDGTLLDSDEALVAPFLELGVPRERITFGHVVAQECARLGIGLDDYVARYDVDAARPFPGVAELLTAVGRWAVCSNKDPRSGRAELRRLGWHPEVALFSDAFDGPKRLEPVLAALDLAPRQALFVGDTPHDRSAAHDAGVRFALAGWNPRAAREPSDLVLCRPMELLEALRAG